jgi:hypothetical protein
MKRLYWGFTLLLLSVAWTIGADPVLVRIERRSGDDRNVLLRQGIPVIKEFNAFLLAWGASGDMEGRLAAAGFEGRVIDRPAGLASYQLAAARGGEEADCAASRGEVVWREENLIILRASGPGRGPSPDDPRCRRQPLRLEPLRPSRAADRLPSPKARGTDARIQSMLDEMPDAVITGTWTDLIASSTTRYASAPGCAQAADWARNRFIANGLQVEEQSWSRQYAPNVVATLPGMAHPERLVVLVGHLDDMPSNGTAPGADDNASGSAMVVAAARELSRYRFENTLVFLLVTGEEEGLLGSAAYARQAAADETDILAALNADMIGWEGDGSPAPEDMDLNYDDASTAVAALMTAVGTVYSGTAAVNAVYCPSMVYSDNASFWDMGYASVCGITDNEDFCNQPGTYPYYHTHADTVAHCGDPAFFASAVRTFVAAGAELAVPVPAHIRPVARP